MGKKETHMQCNRNWISLIKKYENILFICLRENLADYMPVNIGKSSFQSIVIIG